MAAHDHVPGLLQARMAEGRSEVGLCDVDEGEGSRRRVLGLSGVEVDDGHAGCWLRGGGAGDDAIGEELGKGRLAG